MMSEALKELMRPEFEEELNTRMEEIVRLITTRVHQEFMEKRRQKDIGYIRILRECDVSVEILNNVYGEQIVNEALGNVEE